ncbi:hypothetical protein L9F63_013987, partial [Diploptera punctata]
STKGFNWKNRRIGVILPDKNNGSGFIAENSGGMHLRLHPANNTLNSLSSRSDILDKAASHLVRIELSQQRMPFM